MTNAEFISRIAPYAIADMQRSHIAASLTIAQAALESGWGNSGLTVKANNLFGMKGSGPAGSIAIRTTEYLYGKPLLVTAAFRAYHDWGESVADHSAVLIGGVSWNRGLYSRVIGVNGQTAAREIAAAGYATDPNYAAKLIRIMDTYNLYQFDEVKEDEEMSAEDKQKLANLETELKELQVLLAVHTDRLTAMEGRTVMNVPVWARPAVNAAVAAGLLDTPAGGSYDFYRLLTVLNRAGLLVTGED
ncbi:glycoside hydrolase family 73 protein [Paenibacillus pedocola]|uniref:glycoside hydrolase family 73 protein n=1 Tax=Paenibacillus pedocola TaxID=3242193 RepID=UPI002877D22E|nr:glucosaminidase domain-containing protein [Paenibacillus typhae]